MFRIVAIVAGLICGILLSQFPEFAQQYEQRLGGAVDELTKVVADFDASAARAGMDRQTALAEYDKLGQTFFADRGTDMRNVITRQERLSSHLANLQDQSPLTRVANFASYFDGGIASRALEAFKPAIPVTIEGLIYAGAGFLSGLGLTYGGRAGVRRVRRRRAGPETAATGRTS